MKIKKNDLLLYLKTNNLSPKLYLLSFITYIVPVMIIAFIDSRPTFLSVNIIMLIPMILVILGNLLSFLKKDSNDKSKITNIGLIIGTLIYLISMYL